MIRHPFVLPTIVLIGSILIQRFGRCCQFDEVRFSGPSVLITDYTPEVDRLTRIVREIDQPECAGEKIWNLRVRRSPSDLAQMLDASSDHNRRWPAGVKIVKIIPDDPDHQLIVIGNEAGYQRVAQMCLRAAP
jgi:hypothetical protein